MRKHRRDAGPYAGTLSLAEAAHRLGVSEHELRRRLAAGELPFEQVRGRLRVPAAAVKGNNQEGER
ncbi:MAG: helix-turn-helix domain-containing protein [Planctomycetota bacterium]